MVNKVVAQVHTTMDVDLFFAMKGMLEARGQSFRGWLHHKVREELADEAARQQWEAQHEQQTVMAQ